MPSPAAPHPLHLSQLSLLLFGYQVAQREIIHHILDILDPVLQTIALPSQNVVLKVQDLEARKHVFDKLIDEERALVVTKRDSVSSQTGLIQLVT